MENEFDIIAEFSDEVSDSRHAYRTRVFAPRFGYLEDPATGSGNSAFGCYLLQQNRLDGEFMSLEQNGSAENPNVIKLASRQNDMHEKQVMFGGGAIVKIAEEYRLS